jgi:glycosyltransferase involved in cell wall biosynthesis
VDRIRSAQVTPTEFAEEHDAIHVAFLGRLEPVKRVDIFLESASNLLSRHPEYDWRFHVFGDGTLREDLEQRARDLGITPVTTFHGHDPFAANYLGSLNCVVLCSDHEGLPMILLEALAAGTPVVGHAVGGIAEVIDGTNGQLVYGQEPDEYAQAILAAVEGRIERDQLPRTALVGETWNTKANAASYLSLYLSATTP